MQVSASSSIQLTKVEDLSQPWIAPENDSRDLRLVFFEYLLGDKVYNLPTIDWSSKPATMFETMKEPVALSKSGDCKILYLLLKVNVAVIRENVLTGKPLLSNHNIPRTILVEARNNDDVVSKISIAAGFLQGDPTVDEHSTPVLYSQNLVYILTSIGNDSNWSNKLKYLIQNGSIASSFITMCDPRTGTNEVKVTRKIELL